MLSKNDPDSIPASGKLMDLLMDEPWRQEAMAAEELLEGHILAGTGQIGWMKTWPQLQTYSQYEQLRSLVLRGFAAVVEECNLGVGQAAAIQSGKILVIKRLTQPNVAIQIQLLKLVEGEPLGPKVELTSERLAALRNIFQTVLLSEDWEAIATAAAQQIQQQIMNLMVA